MTKSKPTPRRRVVLTGCGVVSAAGCELPKFWDALMQGTCFIQPLRHFIVPGLSDARGAEVDLPEHSLASHEEGARRRDRCNLLANLAARKAMVDAFVSPNLATEARMGVAIGTTLGEERQLNHVSERRAEQGDDAIGADFFQLADNTRLPLSIAREHELVGPLLLNATACSSGNAATAWAYDLVADGTVDMMLAGGADTLTRVTYCGFARMNALSKSTCKPFDKDRDGVSFGEGAGVMVLEELEHARRRSARIYAELCGYGISNDAHHITAPEPSGEGFARAIKQALESTQTPRSAVDYVSAHGTGTAYNDIGEALALKEVFGELSRDLPVSSIKSMLGHTNGAASAIESVACALALLHRALPPTANLSEPDPRIELDLIRDRGRAANVRTCLNMAAGFGGFNVCLVLKEAP